MRRKNLLLLFSITVFHLSCWKYRNNDVGPNGLYTYTSPSKVMGYKPVYGTETTAKGISYSPTPKPVTTAGNIYAFRNYIFQVQPGYGIHLIDNSVPSGAKRIGFINVNGCAQISIKGDKLYTNSYDDLVVIDFSDLAHVKEVSRAKGVFTEYRYDSPLSQPPGPGYYECPVYGNFVVEWKRDSVLQQCYKAN